MEETLTLANIRQGLRKPRSGWLARGLPHDIAETVLVHTRKVALAAGIVSQRTSGIDVKKTIAMAYAHDLAEFVECDYIPGQISPEEKFRREKKVLEDISNRLPILGKILFELWLEFEEGKTQEAKMVRQLDIHDPGVQALQYKSAYPKVADFIPWVNSKLQDPFLRLVWQRLQQEELPGDEYFRRYIYLLHSVQS